jgi:poly-gamma-glutamate synthesis protein (capsule biosynthesis protein)
MKTITHNPLLKSTLLLLALILAACTAETATQTAQPTPANPGTEEAAAAPTSTEPLRLYLADGLPAGLLQTDSLSAFSFGNFPTADLWLGLANDAPAGSILAQSAWVYALAAPFPTLTDSVSLAEIEAYWRGEGSGAMSGVEALYLPSAIGNLWQTQWGQAVNPAVIVSDELPPADALWEGNAWAVLPFETLESSLKVIAVDGLSPLADDFNTESYPLTLDFVLVQAEDGSIDPETVQPVLDALAATNRDPDKMTTLVMTGVTALVRATAYRMEEYGVLYPAEGIVDWLTSADLTHISNEVSFYEDCPYPNPHSRLLFFCSNPDYIELFDYVGADIIELTGNHNNDSAYVYGVDVVPFSLDLYNERGMVYFGGGLDLSDAMTPATITHNGNKLAFIGCNASGPDYAWATDEHGGSAPCGDYEWMTAEISRLKEEGYLPIATFQYYEDYYSFPSEMMVHDFGLMADAGAVIVNGSQAHFPKGMDFRNDAFIDYGLGNLFFDQMGYTLPNGENTSKTRWEIIQRHTFYDGKLLSTELLTAMLYDYAQPRPMTEMERQVFLQDLFTASGWISK